VKVVLSIGFGLTAALIGLDLKKSAGMWALPPALAQRHEAGGPVTSGLLIGIFGKRVWFKRPNDTPWDEIASNLAFQVRAGKTLVQAIHSVSQEGTSWAHKRLGKAYRLYETGVPIFRALEMASDGDGELFMIAGVLEIGSISGGDTAALLWHVFEILRRRRVFRGEVDARLSEARITSWLLLVLPWGIGLFMFRHDPSLFQTFIASPEGKLLFIVAVALWAVGMFLIIAALGSVSPPGADGRRQGGSNLES